MIGVYKYDSLTLEYFSLIQNAVKNGIKADDYKPIGFDLTTDASPWLRNAQNAAAAANKPLILPNYRIFLANEFKLNTNVPIYYNHEGGEQWIIPSNNRRYRIFSVDKMDGNHLVNFNLKGDNESRPPNAGEDSDGHLIDVLRSKNVTIWNPICQHAYADGVYFGAPEYPENITLINPWIYKCGRNGITITAGKNIRIEGGYCEGSIANPASAIDIEPNLNHYIYNISIKDFVSKQNGITGFMMGLYALYNDGLPHDIGRIEFINCSDHGSPKGLWIGIYPYTAKNHIKGDVYVENLKLTGARVDYQYAPWQVNESQINLKIKNPKIENKLGNGIFLTQSELKYNFETLSGVNTPRPIFELT